MKSDGNGTVSVISAVTAALLALAFGFTFVLVVGAVGYGLAALLAMTAVRSLRGAGEGHEHDAAETLSGD